MVPATIPDVHCHLEMIEDAERAIDEAREARVGPILAVSTDQTSGERTLALRQRFPDIVLASIGLHPSEIPRLDAAQLRDELDFVRDNLGRADALGEVGLDYRDAVDDRQRVRQQEALAAQLEWAANLRKPVSMHSRRAERDILDIAAAFTQRTGLGVDMHWFTHSMKLVRRCAEAGLYISPGPSILDSEPQIEVAIQVAPDLLLLETDSPVEYEGEVARPAWALLVATRLAARRGEELDALVERLQVNLRRFLGATAPGTP